MRTNQDLKRLLSMGPHIPIVDRAHGVLGALEYCLEWHLNAEVSAGWNVR